MTVEIQLAIAKMLVLKMHSPVMENIQPFFHYEYDVLSFSKSKKLYEFEVKISRSDFLRPKEKEKQRVYGLPINVDGCAMGLSRYEYVPNYFSYCCPSALIQLSELPPYAGLYYFENNEVTEVRAPRQLHKYDKYLNERLSKKLFRYYSERTYFGGCRMTYDNRQINKRRAAVTS